MMRAMRYDEQALESISEKYSEVSRIHDQLMLRLFFAESRLHDGKAKAYLLQGVARRLKSLTRCIENIFTIFPVDRTDRLSPEELTDVDINLHAFFVNIWGLFDNLAWVFVIEKGLFGRPKEGKLSKKDIGLFNRKTQSHLPESIRTYLTSEHIMSWYSEYSKNYRDALAHRIPMYIPPFILVGEEQEKYLALEEQIRKLDFSLPETPAICDELREKQEALGQPSLVFTHSFDEKSGFVFLHNQLIIDYLTVEEVLNTICDELWPTRK
jgi:hypothetical protein